MTTEKALTPAGATFQQRVQPWLMECFGVMIAGDREERNHRFLEESLELVQSLGCTASEAHQLLDYVYGRPVGEPVQEVGGVMVTLAALCLANGLDMHEAGEIELARISVPEVVAKIRAKQAAKPKYGPLPMAAQQAPAGAAVWQGRWAWVPVEPSTAMLVAGNHGQSGDFSALKVWQDMFEALHWHDYQLQQLSAGELHGIAKKLIAQTQSSGGAFERRSLADMGLEQTI